MALRLLLWTGLGTTRWDVLGQRVSNGSPRIRSFFGNGFVWPIVQQAENCPWGAWRRSWYDYSIFFLVPVCLCSDHRRCDLAQLPIVSFILFSLVIGCECCVVSLMGLSWSCQALIFLCNWYLPDECIMTIMDYASDPCVLALYWFEKLMVDFRFCLVWVGTVADVILWRRNKLTWGILVVTLAAWVVFEISGYTLLSLSSSVLLLLTTILFLWAKSAAILNR